LGGSQQVGDAWGVEDAVPWGVAEPDEGIAREERSGDVLESGADAAAACVARAVCFEALLGEVVFCLVFGIGVCGEDGPSLDGYRRAYIRTVDDIPLAGI